MLTEHQPFPEESYGTRVDLFLKTCFPDVSRKYIQDLIKNGAFSIDHITITDTAERIKPHHKQWQFAMETPTRAQNDKPIPENIPLNIVFEDEHLLVINKPAGLTVHPGAGITHNTLVNGILYHTAIEHSDDQSQRPSIVHRIDRNTTGLLVVAKTLKAHGGLAEQFRDHSIEREYEAFVFGYPGKGTVDLPIGRDPRDHTKQMIHGNNEKEAITHYQTVATFKKLFSHIRCQLETGRTHQIRVHMESIKKPLIGDKKYDTHSPTYLKSMPSDLRSTLAQFPRQALHASVLGFIHPISGERIHFKAPLPEDMQPLLTWMIHTHKKHSVDNQF